MAKPTAVEEMDALFAVPAQGPPPSAPLSAKAKMDALFAVPEQAPPTSAPRSAKEEMDALFAIPAQAPDLVAVAVPAIPSPEAAPAEPETFEWEPPVQRQMQRAWKEAYPSPPVPMGVEGEEGGEVEEGEDYQPAPKPPPPFLLGRPDPAAVELEKAHIHDTALQPTDRPGFEMRPDINPAAPVYMDVDEQRWWDDRKQAAEMDRYAKVIERAGPYAKMEPVKRILEETNPTFFGLAEHYTGEPSTADSVATTLMKAATALGTLQRPVATLLRAHYEDEIAAHNERARAGDIDWQTGERVQPIVDPSTNEPFPTARKTAAQVMDEVKESLALVPQRQRFNTSYIDVLQAKSLAEGGTGREPWVYGVGIAGDFALDPIFFSGVGKAKFGTELARLRKLTSAIAEADTKLGGAFAKDALANAQRVTADTIQAVDRAYAAGATAPFDLVEPLARRYDDIWFTARSDAANLERAGDIVGAAAETRRTDVAKATAERIRLIKDAAQDPFVTLSVPFSKTLIGRPLQVDLLPVIPLHRIARESVAARDFARMADALEVEAHAGLEQVRSGIAQIQRKGGRSVDELDLVTLSVDKPHALAGRVKFWAGDKIDRDLASDLERMARSAHARAIIRADSANEAVRLMETDGLSYMAEGIPEARAIGMQAMVDAHMEKIVAEMVGAGPKKIARLTAEQSALQGMATVLQGRTGKSGMEARKLRAASVDPIVDDLSGMMGLLAQSKKHIRDHFAEYRQAQAKLDGGLTALREAQQAAAKEHIEYFKGHDIPVGEVDNYIRHEVGNKEQVLTFVGAGVDGLMMESPLHHRKLGSIEELATKGYEPVTNVLELMEAEARAFKLISLKYATKDGIVARWGHEVKPGSWVEPTEFELMTHRGHRYAVPKDVAKEIREVERMWTPENIGTWLRLTDVVQAIWKTKAINKVGFVTRNLFSSTWNMMLEGWSGRQLGRALAVLQQGTVVKEEQRLLGLKVREGFKPRPLAKGQVLLAGAERVRSGKMAVGDAADAVLARSREWLMDKAKKSADEVFTDPFNREWTNRKLYDHLVRDGIVDSGQVAMDIERREVIKFQRSPTYRLARELYRDVIAPINPLGGDHALIRLVNPANKGVENYLRAVLWLDRVLVSGDTPAAATAAVGRAMFNYRKITNKERWAKRAVPFFKWTRHNLPLQVAGLIRNPGQMAIPAKVQRAFGKYYQDTVERRRRILAGDVPWLVRGMGAYQMPGAWPLSKEEVGSDLLFATPDLPPRDLNLLQYDEWEQYLSMLTPVPRLVAEFGVDRYLRKGGRRFGMVELPIYMDNVGAWLKEKHPSMVTTIMRRDKQGTEYEARMIDERLYYGLKTMLPDVFSWERLILPARDPERIREQKLRLISEFTGVGKFQLVKPEMLNTRKMRDTRNALGSELPALEVQFPPYLNPPVPPEQMPGMPTRRR